MRLGVGMVDLGLAGALGLWQVHVLSHPWQCIWKEFCKTDRAQTLPILYPNGATTARRCSSITWACALGLLCLARGGCEGGLPAPPPSWRKLDAGAGVGIEPWGARG